MTILRSSSNIAIEMLIVILDPIIILLTFDFAISESPSRDWKRSVAEPYVHLSTLIYCILPSRERIAPRIISDSLRRVLRLYKKTGDIVCDRSIWSLYSVNFVW